ncbi:DNA primase family protein [Fundidesulfovibrio soli]|uniref:DNA primase family protein n=1 Tax=Fundidesulfovibrio soli TaxID=2922716 RepID=UPI001FAFD6E7|nr:DNA primase family protein [Fundidesulfovibrio soli]
MSKETNDIAASSPAASEVIQKACVPDKVTHPLTDLGNADLFAEMFKDEVHYVPELDRWIVWTKGKWSASKGELMGRVRRLLEERRAESNYPGNLVTIYGEDVGKKDAKKWLAKSQSKSRIDAMLELAKVDPKISVSQDELDNNPYLLGVQNGTLDLVTGIRRPSTPEDLITQYVRVKYDPEATCPGWEKFIDQVTCGQKDLANYIQENLGYALSGSVQEQQMIVFTGKGKNGKSTLVDVILEVMGDYGKTTPAHTLMKSESRAIRNDIARLRGARFVSAVEINTGKHLDEALVKRLTGGDKMTARFIGREYFEFVPQAKFFLAVNTLPEVSGADDGIYRRIRIIPFDLSVSEDEVNKGLAEELKQEKAGILAWAVRGFKHWHANGKLTEPACVRDASRDFRSVMDTIGSFIEDECERDKSKRVPKGLLFSEYQKWASRACIEPVSMKKFGILIRQQGFKEQKSDGIRFWQGITCLELTSQPTSVSPSTSSQQDPSTGPVQ